MGLFVFFSFFQNPVCAVCAVCAVHVRVRVCKCSCVYICLSFPKRFNSIRFISNIHNLHIHNVRIYACLCICMCLWLVQLYGPTILSYFHICLSAIECNLLVPIFRVIISFFVFFPFLGSAPLNSTHEINIYNIQTSITRGNNVLQKYFVVFTFFFKNPFLFH